MIRAVVDANVLFSATILARGIPYQLVLAWREQRYVLLSSPGIISELEENLRDPRQSSRYHLSEEDIQALLTLLRGQAELVPAPMHERHFVTGDPEDDYVLATTRLGNAEYLVTGDRRLLNLKKYAGATIVSPREFVALLDAERLNEGSGR